MQYLSSQFNFSKYSFRNHVTRKILNKVNQVFSKTESQFLLCRIWFSFIYTLDLLGNNIYKKATAQLAHDFQRWAKRKFRCLRNCGSNCALMRYALYTPILQKCNLLWLFF